MNMDFMMNQWVRILHCNIYFIDRNYQICKVFGDVLTGGNPLYADSSFLKMLADRDMKDCPAVYCEYHSVLYAAMPLNDRKLVLGPVSIIKTAKGLEKFMADTHGTDETVFNQIAFCEMEVFGAGVLTLFHCITGKERTLEELWNMNGLSGLDIREARSHIQEVIFGRQETGMPHNPYDRERRELDSIRRGDTEMLKQSIQEVYRGHVGVLSKNELRQAKNIAICAITLASRAAIDGGLLPEEAFSMVDSYILKIEEMTNIVHVETATRQAQYEFADRVSSISSKTQKNELIERTKNYIFQNLHSEIVIGEIGHKVGVSQTYLCDLFRKVEGITMQQYTRREKIRLAENLLRYSSYDVKSIASYLAFCSQSHFGKVFKEQTGMTPTKYRKKYGNLQKNENIR